MGKHARAKPIFGYHVVRVKRGVWKVPGVFIADGSEMHGTLAEITLWLKQRQIELDIEGLDR